MAAALTSQAETMKLPFEQLTGQDKMELRCISDQREIQVPVPERWLVKRAIVHLRYTVSANLIPDTSTLVIKLRGEPIAQARLNPQAPDVKLGVELPAAKLLSSTATSEPGFTRAARLRTKRPSSPFLTCDHQNPAKAASQPGCSSTFIKSPTVTLAG